jgi:bifunctional DNase/RNase
MRESFKPRRGKLNTMKAGKGTRINGREKALIILTLVSISLAAIAVLDQRGRVGVPETMEAAGIADLSTEGFVTVRPQAEVINGKGVLAMTGGCYRLVAGTDAAQAESIKDALDSVTGPRPNTHELMRDALGQLGVEVVMVKVTRLEDDNFLGRTLLRRGDTLVNLDSRPSDGAALALRMGAPIYFNETLLRERGQKVC